MPESKGRRKRPTETGESRQGRPAKAKTPNPVWYVPVMVGLMIVGMLWIVTFYLSQGAYPVSAWGNWNLIAGFGLVIAGFLMTTNWR